MANIYARLMGQLGVKGRYVKGDGAAGPRGLVGFSNSFIVEHFERLGYAVDYDQLVFTTESVADFVAARETLWHKPGTVTELDIAGILVVEDAQPRPDQPTRDIAVVSLGDARVVMGVTDRSPRIPIRYASTM